MFGRYTYMLYEFKSPYILLIYVHLMLFLLFQDKEVASIIENVYSKFKLMLIKKESWIHVLITVNWESQYSGFIVIIKSQNYTIKLNKILILQLGTLQEYVDIYYLEIDFFLQNISMRKYELRQKKSIVILSIKTPMP